MCSLQPLPSGPPLAPEDTKESNPANLPTTNAGWSALSATLKRLIAHRLRGHGSNADVEEIAQEALLHLIQRAQTGLYANYTTTNQALTIATGLIANKKRGEHRQHTYWIDPERIIEREAQKSRPPLEQVVDHRLAIQRLRHVVSNDNASSVVLEATLLGIKGHSEAIHLGLNKADFENAKRRIKRLIKKNWATTTR